MIEAVFLIARYQLWIYALLGLVSLVYVRALGQARHVLSQTPFGLEREAAFQKRNGALAMLFILAALVFSVFIISRYITPGLRLTGPTPAPGAGSIPAPSPTPIGADKAGGPLAIDSSGCRNSNATLTEPQPKTRISGSFAVRGTANIENFAFYTLDISGEKTNGVWVPLHVGSQPVSNGDLGTLDSSAYDSGEYALRLVVKDSAGNFPPPCVVPVTIVAIGGEATPP